MTFVERFEATGDGLRLAVKNVIDVEGVVTSCGSPVLGEQRGPAVRDAGCVAQARKAGAEIVGVTVCDELALGATGINEHMGTPTNPLDPDLVPGGSSSGSAVAVATGEADVALGSDAGGSIRIPATCCGVVGLRTTPARLATAGVTGFPMGVDSIGPMARDVAGVVAGMRLFEPDFEPESRDRWRVGRFRPQGVDEEIDGAVDALLASDGIEVVEVDLPGFADARNAAGIILIAAAWRTHVDLVGADGLSQGVADRLAVGAAIEPDQMADLERIRTAWRHELDRVFQGVDVIALPALATQPPRLDEDRTDADISLSALTLPANLAGLPALAMPAPAEDGVIAGVQLLAPHHRDERLAGVGLVLERAATTR